MAKAQVITKGDKTYYRVQIRRPTKGVSVDELFTTKRAADAFIRRVDRAMEEGKPVAENVGSRELFADAVDLYLADPAAMQSRTGRPLKPSAAKDRKERLKWLSKECFGQIALRRLTWAVADAKLSAKAQALGWKPATRYRYETTLSRFMDYARRKGWAAFNPVADQDRLNDSDARQRTYTGEEWQALLAAADKREDMLGMFLRLAWETGCRKSELLRLRWVDVEPFEHETLGARIELRDTKNREDRVVFITKAAYALLVKHGETYRKDTSPRVFPSRNKAGTWNPDPPFREASIAAGLDLPDEKHGEVLSIHHIRHSWATRLGDSGASLAQLMAAGGWKTAQMAMRYMKRKEAQSAEAAALLVTP